MFGTFIEGMMNIYKKCKDAGKNHLSFIIILVACVATTYYLQYNFEERMTERLGSKIIEIDNQKKDAHLEGFSKSMDTYYLIKSTMRKHREITNADYILMLEYHNGAENIATGYQFCKFDITMEARADEVPYIQIDEYRDESIFKYDIFMHREVSDNRLSIFSMEDIEKADPHFYYQIKTATTSPIKYVITAHLYYRNYKAGAMIFLFTDSDITNINRISVSNCVSDIERILVNSNIK